MLASSSSLFLLLSLCNAFAFAFATHHNSEGEHAAEADYDVSHLVASAAALDALPLAADSDTAGLYVRAHGTRKRTLYTAQNEIDCHLVRRSCF